MLVVEKRVTRDRIVELSIRVSRDLHVLSLFCAFLVFVCRNFLYFLHRVGCFSNQNLLVCLFCLVESVRFCEMEDSAWRRLFFLGAFLLLLSCATIPRGMVLLFFW